MARRRFGVSIPEEIANKLDEIARALRVDRSRLVAEALRTFVHDHMHLVVEHECKGVLLVVGASEYGSMLREIVEKHIDVVRGHIHTHVDGTCVDILLVSGSSSRIASLARSLARIRGCRTRYIPLNVGLEGSASGLAGAREATRR